MERKSFDKKQENLKLIVPEVYKAAAIPFSPLRTFVSTINQRGFSRFWPCPGNPFAQAGEVIGVDCLAGFYKLSIRFTICKYLVFFKRCR
jgi:hypothetical protein